MIGFGQGVINYKSDFLTFSYYDTYTLDDSRYYVDPSDKSVKLSCNSCDYGSLDNIGINYLPIPGDNKVNIMELFTIVKQETESQFLKMGVDMDFSLVKIGTETIKGEEIPYFTSKMEIVRPQKTTFQKMYIYQTSTQQLIG